MPTSRRRHAITETDSVTEALRAAAARWPEDAHRPQRLVLRLLQEGCRSLQRERDRERVRREDAVDDTSGALTGVYEHDYLTTLREDWPP